MVCVFLVIHSEAQLFHPPFHLYPLSSSLQEKLAVLLLEVSFFVCMLHTYRTPFLVCSNLTALEYRNVPYQKM